MLIIPAFAKAKTLIQYDALKEKEMQQMRTNYFSRHGKKRQMISRNSHRRIMLLDIKIVSRTN